MKKLMLSALVFATAFIACQSDYQKEIEERKAKKKAEIEEESKVPASERITLDNKGVGPIKNIELTAEIDEEMVQRGMELFKTNCTACHKVDKRFIGPSPKGIMKRRSPEWIMNMILDPQLMVEQDRCAKDLLVEFNGAAMANQNMTEEQARDILEYFRTLE
ncbi:MAG: cytochrome C [Flavobacteriales bacterium]|nr:cytochrome C [Flavobacteriales bacterium]|tara:strand:+ start:876 stop:1361 length:486 start_codon:yes stop_codon:yes gene_type:complete